MSVRLFEEEARNEAYIGVKRALARYMQLVSEEEVGDIEDHMVDISRVAAQIVSIEGPEAYLDEEAEEADEEYSLEAENEDLIAIAGRLMQESMSSSAEKAREDLEAERAKVKGRELRLCAMAAMEGYIARGGQGSHNDVALLAVRSAEALQRELERRGHFSC